MARTIKLPNIYHEINLALKMGFHRFILVVGEKNLGKSTLCVGLLYEIFKPYFDDYEERWKEVFHHICFTPRQFYNFYIKAKKGIDDALISRGLNSDILSADVQNDWEKIIDMVIESNVKTFEGIRAKHRIKGILIDDIGAHMSRQDVSIYYDPFFQKLFGDLTLIRPYIACILATCPDIGDVPRVILKHVTDIIIVQTQGSGIYRKKKRYVRYKGKEVEGYMKLYDGDKIIWHELPDPIYAKYEVLRHVMSNYVTRQANEALSIRDESHLPKSQKPYIETESLGSSQSSPFISLNYKKQIADSLKFQGYRVTESFTSEDPDLIVWKDATTPKEVIAIRGIRIE